MGMIFLSGGTGTVGQTFVPALKRHNHGIIYLTRGPNALGRIQEQIGRYWGEEDKCWESDIDQPFCGVDLSPLKNTNLSIDHFIHLAGSIKFDEELGSETFKRKLTSLSEFIFPTFSMAPSFTAKI